MATLPTFYMIQAPDAVQVIVGLQGILQNLKSEKRIREFLILDMNVPLTSLINKLKDQDLILIVLSKQLVSNKEQIEGQFEYNILWQPKLKVAELIVDNVPFNKFFITLPADYRPLRNREDIDAAWSSIEQDLKELLPLPTGWLNYLKKLGRW